MGSNCWPFTIPPWYTSVGVRVRATSRRLLQVVRWPMHIVGVVQRRSIYGPQHEILRPWSEGRVWSWFPTRWRPGGASAVTTSWLPHHCGHRPRCQHSDCDHQKLDAGSWASNAWDVERLDGNKSAKICLWIVRTKLRCSHVAGPSTSCLFSLRARRRIWCIQKKRGGTLKWGQRHCKRHSIEIGIVWENPPLSDPELAETLCETELTETLGEPALTNTLGIWDGAKPTPEAAATRTEPRPQQPSSSILAAPGRNQVQLRYQLENTLGKGQSARYLFTLRNNYKYKSWAARFCGRYLHVEYILYYIVNTIKQLWASLDGHYIVDR